MLECILYWQRSGWRPFVVTMKQANPESINTKGANKLMRTGTHVRT